LRFYTISGLLHLSALVLLLSLQGGNGIASFGEEQGAGNQSRKGADTSTVIEREKQVEVEILEKTNDSEAEIKIAKQKQMDADKECPGMWYGGIGIMEYNNVIEKVFKGYGAEAAGLKEGDVIVALSEPEILGTPGTEFIMTINRNGEIKRLFITRTKVCY
jgi:hypothetical protein